jgi:hypothetical protein
MNKNSAKVVRYRIRIKQRLIEYKGGKCQICEYNKSVPGAYHFHHRNANEKSFEINGSTLGFEQLKKEVDKCDLLCANCHAEVHDLDWAFQREDALVIRRNKKEIRVCMTCENEFLPKRKEQKYCCRSCSPTVFKKLNPARD